MTTNSMRMQWIILFAVYRIITQVVSTETEAETVLSDTTGDALSPSVESGALLHITETETVLPMLTSIAPENYTLPYMIGYNQPVLSCISFPLDPAEYVFLSNSTIYVETYNKTFDQSHYFIVNGTLLLCDPLAEMDFTPVTHEDKEYVKDTSYLTLIGLIISMVSLLIHLIVFAVVPDLRNLPGCNLAALCASLFCSYLLLSVIGPADLHQYEDICIAVAFMLHFLLLSSVLWMSIMSYDVFMSLLRATGSLRISSTHFTYKKFGFYCLCSFGVSFVFAVSSLLTDIFDIVPEVYKPQYKKRCWFDHKIPLTIFFGAPVIALCCLNFIFFGLSACTLHYNKMKKDPDDQKSVLKRRYFMYFRLSVIMGVTWIVGIVAAAFNADWMWYIFVILNTLQGFFLFIAFTCSKKVKKYFREKFLGSRRGSQQTLSPTFQSYCFYANSIEKDMDKIVENSKEKTDTIMIHL